MRKTKAFSLFELLAVMSILCILAAAAVPTLSSLRGARSTNATVELISLLERSRQYARANNTYVYVSVLDDSSSPDQEMLVNVVASNDGTDISAQGTRSFALGNGDSDARQLTPTLKLPGIAPRPTATIPDSVVPRPDPSQSVDVETPSAASYTAHGGDQLPVSFWFAPDGTANQNAVLPTRLELAFQPAHSTEPGTASVIQIAGLTGAVRAYRAE